MAVAIAQSILLFAVNIESLGDVTCEGSWQVFKVAESVRDVRTVSGWPCIWL